MHKCSECKTEMEFKAEISSEEGLLFFQCPNCKNVELRVRQYESDLRMSYP